MKTRRSLDRALPFLFAALGLAGPLASQRAAPAEPAGAAFVATFGGPDADLATCLAPGPRGDVFVGGWTQSYGAGDFDLWVARIDRRGRAKWEQAIGGTAKDDAAAIAATPDGGCILVGSTWSSGAGQADGWAVKLAADGAIQWQRALGGPLEDELRTVAVSPDGYYAGGWTTSAETGRDAWVLELDAEGDVLWQETFVGTQDDHVLSLDATGAGVVLVGASNSELGKVSGAVFTRPFLCELSGTGGVLWQKAYDYSGGDVWNHVVALPGGGFVVTGEILAFAFLRGDLWAVRLDEDGDVLWDRRYGDNFSTFAFDGGVQVAPAAGGGFGVVGSTATAGAGSDDLWLLSLDASGELSWGRTYGGPHFDGATGLARSPGGGYTIVGRIQPASTAPPDALVMRVTATGGTTRTCEVAGEVAPNAWTDTLSVEAFTLPPSPTAFVPTTTQATATALETGVFACAPGVSGKPEPPAASD